MGGLGESTMGGLGESTMGGLGESTMGGLGESTMGGLGESTMGGLGESTIRGCSECELYIGQYEFCYSCMSFVGRVSAVEVLKCREYWLICAPWVIRPLVKPPLGDPPPG